MLRAIGIFLTFFLLYNTNGDGSLPGDDASSLSTEGLTENIDFCEVDCPSNQWCRKSINSSCEIFEGVSCTCTQDKLCTNYQETGEICFISVAFEELSCKQLKCNPARDMCILTAMEPMSTNAHQGTCTAIRSSIQ